MDVFTLVLIPDSPHTIITNTWCSLGCKTRLSARLSARLSGYRVRRALYFIFALVKTQSPSTPSSNSAKKQNKTNKPNKQCMEPPACARSPTPANNRLQFQANTCYEEASPSLVPHRHTHTHTPKHTDLHTELYSETNGMELEP